MQKNQQKKSGIGTLGGAGAALVWGLLGCGGGGAPQEEATEREQALPTSSLLPSTGGLGAGFMINKPQVRSIWGSGDKDIWAVGLQGMVVHWNGKTWQRIAVPTSNNLLATWGSSDKDVWAVGDGGAMIRWNGMRWSKIATPVGVDATLNDVWGSGGSDIWAVGDGGTLLHYDGTVWMETPLPTINNLLTVWAASRMDAWVGGDLGTLYRWDGSNWNEQASGSALAFLHIRGWSASKVFAMKGDERLWSWDGMAWAMPAVSPSGNRLWINGDREQFVVGSNNVFRWTGTMWANTFITATAAFSTSPTNVWTFTASDIYRYNGTNWDYRW